MSIYKEAWFISSFCTQYSIHFYIVKQQMETSARYRLELIVVWWTQFDYMWRYNLHTVLFVTTGLIDLTHKSKTELLANDAKDNVPTQKIPLPTPPVQYNQTTEARNQETPAPKLQSSDTYPWRTCPTGRPRPSRAGRTLAGSADRRGATHPESAAWVSTTCQSPSKTP